MKNVVCGEIYEFSGIYHLVLEVSQNTSRKMVWCSIDNNNDLDTLLKVNNYSIVTPREEWRYVDKVTDNDLKVALQNFRLCLDKQVHFENKTFGKKS